MGFYLLNRQQIRKVNRMKKQQVINPTHSYYLGMPEAAATKAYIVDANGIQRATLTLAEAFAL